MIRVYHRTSGPYVLVVDETSPAFHDGPTMTDARPIFAVEFSRLVILEPDFRDVMNDRRHWPAFRHIVTEDAPRWTGTDVGVAALGAIEREGPVFVLRSPWHPGTLQLTAPELCAVFHSRLAHSHASSSSGADG